MSTTWSWEVCESCDSDEPQKWCMWVKNANRKMKWRCQSCHDYFTKGFDAEDDNKDKGGGDPTTDDGMKCPTCQHWCKAGSWSVKAHCMSKIKCITPELLEKTFWTSEDRVEMLECRDWHLNKDNDKGKGESKGSHDMSWTSSSRRDSRSSRGNRSRSRSRGNRSRSRSRGSKNVYLKSRDHRR